jgi:hypothetical protein
VGLNSKSNKYTPSLLSIIHLVLHQAMRRPIVGLNSKSNEYTPSLLSILSKYGALLFVLIYSIDYLD